MELDWTKIIFGLVFAGLIVFAVIRGLMPKKSPKQDADKSIVK